MKSSTTIAAAISAMLSAYAAATPSVAISAPASTGPLTKASCWTVEFTATALTKISRGTTSGSSDCRDGPSNADATASSSTIA
jgi:hypothetical protein